jgi:hypothetical protein
MPQLDKVTYSSQIFWCFITFSTLYFVLLRNILPKIAKVLEERKNLISNYENILNSFEKEEEQENTINDINIISTATDLLKSIIKFDNSDIEYINNQHSFVLLQMFKSGKLTGKFTA